MIEVLSVVRGSSPEEVEREFDGSGYGDFKAAVAEEVVGLLEPVRSRYLELRPDEEGLERTLREGAESARAMASETLSDVRRVMGVGPPV
jgi:tryptophanyl-tRNA synthetase